MSGGVLWGWSPVCTVSSETDGKGGTGMMR